MIDKEFTDLKVFLTEPSKTQQLIISHYLNELGISDIRTLNSGEETLEVLQQDDPDLIISSMYLPDMTGVDLVHRIREDSDSYNMAFLLISSETNIKYLEPIRQAGAIAILPKPFTLEELDTALCATLDYLNPKHLQLKHLDTEDLTVLLVDDSMISLKYISKILNDIGVVNITQSHNGKEAFELINNHYFDLIITDYNMPEMDGLQLINAVRQDSNQKAIPILMVTSEQNENRLAAVEQSGVSAILDKPFEPTSIRKLITQLLN
jgi:two-component system chemotaxis response regulator CheY